MRLGAILLTTTMAALGAPAAVACSLPIPPWFEPPPGLSPEESARFQNEAEADWAFQNKVWEQYRLWTLADSVILAQIDARPPKTITVRSGSATETIDVRDIVLRPIHWLKGEGEATPFRLGAKDFGWCGPEPWWPAMNGAIGDQQVVYIAGGLPAQETVLNVIPIADIVEFETKSRLPPAQ